MLPPINSNLIILCLRKSRTCGKTRVFGGKRSGRRLRSAKNRHGKRRNSAVADFPNFSCRRYKSPCFTRHQKGAIVMKPFFCVADGWVGWATAGG
jgi:hypothetical protein